MVGRRRGREVQPQHLDQHELGQPRRDQRSGSRFDGDTLLQRVVDARLHPAAAADRRAGAPRTPGGNARSAGSNSGSSRVEVAAHEVGPRGHRRRGAARHHVPRQRVEQREDRARTRPVASPPITCWSPYGMTITSPALGPVAHRRRRPRPSTSRGRRCGTGSAARRPGRSASASGERRRLERERLGELGAEEDRAFEAQLLERRRAPASVIATHLVVSRPAPPVSSVMGVSLDSSRY